MQIALATNALRFEALMWMRHGYEKSGRISLQFGGNVESKELPHENAPWTWRIDPTTVEHMMEPEVCDSWPAFIEANKQKWIAAPTYLCHWGCRPSRSS